MDKPMYFIQDAKFSESFVPALSLLQAYTSHVQETTGRLTEIFSLNFVHIVQIFSKNVYA